MDSVIYTENCITGLKKLGPRSVDVCFTTPPSYEEFKNNPQLGRKTTSVNDYVLGLTQVFRGVKRVMKDGGVLWIKISDHSLGENAGFVGVLPLLAAALVKSKWTYQSIVTWGLVEENSERFPDYAGNYKNTEKSVVLCLSKGPVEDPKRVKDASDGASITLVENMKYVFAFMKQNQELSCIEASCPIGGTVLDPFMGVGSTAAVCAELKLNFVGFEIDKTTSRKAASKIVLGA
jgi:DNA modification methylase